MGSNANYVSVIIPTYNRAFELDRCLNSLVNQTVNCFEVIVCDDGSTDNTSEVVEKYKTLLNITYLKDVNFGGPSRPRNNGIKQSQGDIIAFLDSDDWWYPNKLEVSMKYIVDYDIVYHNLEIKSDNNKFRGVVKSKKLDEFNVFKDLIINGNPIPNSSVLIKKDIVNIIGFVSEEEELIAVEDYDFWIRVSRHTNKFYFLNEILGGYWVGSNISYSISQIERDRALLNKYISFLSPKERKIALNLRKFNSARLYHKLGYFDIGKKIYFDLINSSNINIALKSFVGYIFCVIKYQY
mgnify:CR=1 FL=1